MTVEEILGVIATMQREDWLKIQCGITELVVGDFSPEEVAEINAALKGSDAEIARGELMTSEEARKQLGLS